MRTSILGTFFLASPTEIHRGEVWYSNAHQVCLDISDKTEIHYKIVAGVVAAISPNNRWERNCHDALMLCEAFIAGGRELASQVKVSTYGNNKRKALDILELFEPNTDAIASILNGQKVTAFFHCILGRDVAVVIDGHAYSIWLGERISTSKTPNITPKVYNIIAEDYRKAAEVINSITCKDYTAAQIQAITWVVHKRLYS